jgi:hypothetical protein
MGSDAPPQRLSLVNPATGELRQLRDTQHLQAAFTPDGGKIAVVTGFLGMGAPGEARAGMVILDPGTGHEQTVVNEVPGLIPSVRWSPDGSKILHTSMASTEAPLRTLHVIGAEGSEGTSLDFADFGVTGVLLDIAWQDNATILLLTRSPRGEVLLYKLAWGRGKPGKAEEIGTFGSIPQHEMAQILMTR